MKIIKNESETKMKRVFNLVLVIVLLLSFFGCGAKNNPESSVSGLLDAVKSVNIIKAQGYIYNVEDLSDANLDDIKKYSGILKCLKTAFNSMTYKIISSEKTDDSHATVKTEITMMNLGKASAYALTEYVVWGFAEGFSGNDVNEEKSIQKVEEYLTKQINEYKEEMITKTVTINVIKSDNNKWLVNIDETVADAILGGIVSSLSDIAGEFFNF